MTDKWIFSEENAIFPYFRHLNYFVCRVQVTEEGACVLRLNACVMCRVHRAVQLPLVLCGGPLGYFALVSKFEPGRLLGQQQPLADHGKHILQGMICKNWPKMGRMDKKPPTGINSAIPN